MTSIKTSHLRTALDECWDCEDRFGLSKRCTLPGEFIDALRGCLNVGMTCETIVAFLRLASALVRVERSVSRNELEVRVRHIVEVMSMDEGE